MKSFIFKIFIFFLLFSTIVCFGQNTPVSIKTVYVFEIRKEIAPPVLRTTQKAFEEAKRCHASVILIHMNTYGGLLDAADSIRSMILRSKIPVYVFINNNAASAGALISIACDSIYMSPGANIGAATVVNQEGKPMPDKYQSYMRSLMRSTAEVKHRNPQIAQEMVNPRIKINGLTNSGQVVTLTTSEAIKYKFCEGEANSIEEVLKDAGIINYKIIKQQITISDSIINFLINPIVSGILIMLIIGGIYFELQTPGIGFPILAAIIAALLYFAPLYIEGLATNWEILIFIAGVILLVLEIFVIPGFGITGIAGIAFIVSGLSLSLIDNMGFDFSHISYGTLFESIFIVIIAAFISIIGSFLISKWLFTTRKTIFGELALSTVQKKSEGYSVSETLYLNLIGKTGYAHTILRPAGKVEIEGDVYDATAETGYIEKGEKIIVVKYETAQLVVRKL